jgi:2-C-methyl-D-erythritol 4-phosphate cytidylyltransferase
MNSAVPKQFLLLQGKPALWHTVNTFLSAYADMSVILVLPGAHLLEGESLKESFSSAASRITVVSGGDTRFGSVKNGLKCVTEPSIVFVHDGVRCLVSAGLIRRCYEQAVEKGSAIPAVSATDSIRITEGENHRVADRKNIRIIQTPQTFRSEVLIPAFEQEYQEAFTDEATVVEAAGHKVFLIEGEYENLKITRPADLLLADRILKERSSAEQL